MSLWCVSSSLRGHSPLALCEGTYLVDCPGLYLLPLSSISFYFLGTRVDDAGQKETVDGAGRKETDLSFKKSRRMFLVYCPAAVLLVSETRTSRCFLLNGLV